MLLVVVKVGVMSRVMVIVSGLVSRARVMVSGVVSMAMVMVSGLELVGLRLYYGLYDVNSIDSTHIYSFMLISLRCRLGLVS